MLQDPKSLKQNKTLIKQTKQNKYCCLHNNYVHNFVLGFLLFTERVSIFFSL